MAKDILTEEDVIQVAKLANIELTSSEIQKYQKQLSKIVEYIKQLEKVDTKNIEPTSQITGLVDVNFADGKDNERKLTTEQVLKNTSNKTKESFKVKAIFDNKDI